MDNQENITPEALPVETGGQGAVADVSVPTEGGADSLSLKELNTMLGKNFSDKDTALKAVKETFSYVGKKTEINEDDLKAKGFVSRTEFEKELFYRDNPDHVKNQDVLEALAKSKGVSLREASQTESYKKLFEGATNYEKSQSLKSVLESNPRLVSAMSRTSNIQELKSQGRTDDARAEAARAIIEAYGLDQE
jgi:hypothetical protein